MRGRKPVPTALKILRGNPGQRPLNLNEPQPEALEAKVPPELAALDDKEARKEWRRTIVPAIERRQITAADRAVALAHCLLWAEWRRLALEAAVSPTVIIGEDNRPHSNPLRRMAHQTLEKLLRVDVELGLTPSSRSRVKVTDAKTPASKWAGLLG
jgi:P27 family predicted phage terminase small subunit